MMPSKVKLALATIAASKASKVRLSYMYGYCRTSFRHADSTWL